MTENYGSGARHTRRDGEVSRQRILDTAARLVTVDGLNGLSISRLADACGMSKSGVYAHFRSKDELQLSALETANEIFRTEVLLRAEKAPEGIERLSALCESFLSHVERGVFPGGCFLASAMSEIGPRSGRIKRCLEEMHRGWMSRLERQVRIGIELGEVREGEDAEQLVFEIDSYLGLGNALFLLYGDSGQMDRARSAVSARLDRARGTA
jgi:AcrR family transcriptional regulator